MAYLKLVKPERFRKFVVENPEFFMKMEEVAEKVNSVTDESILKWANSKEGISFLKDLNRMRCEVCIGLHSSMYLKVSDSFKAHVAFKLLMGQIPVVSTQSNSKIVVTRADDHVYVIDRATGEAKGYTVFDFIQETIPGYDNDVIREYQLIYVNFGYRIVHYLLRLDVILCNCLRTNHVNPKGTSLMTFDAYTLISTIRELLSIKNTIV